MSARGIHGRAARAGGALVLVVLMAMLPRLAAAEPAGRVIFAVGSTTAVAADGSERALGRGDDVNVGDTLVTGRGGRVQVRFDDGALLDLKPVSRFALDEYREPAEDEGGSVLMRLFKGAMRTITGAIGRGEDDAYQVDTPVATIGIRGTEYSLQYCDSDCAGAGRALGLYGRTDDGSIRVSNEHGTTDFDAGQYFFVPPDGPPEALLTPPPGVLDGSEDGRTGRPGGDEDDRVPGGVTIDEGDLDPLGLDLDGDPFAPVFEEGDDRSEDARTRIRLDGAQFAGGFGGDGTFGRDLFVSAASGPELWIDGGGAVIQADFRRVETRDSGTLNVSGARLAEFDTTTAGDAEVTWGRWAGEFTLDGAAFDGGFSFAYLDAADLTETAVLNDLQANVTYSSPSGPAAVDQAGGLWDVDTLSFIVNFADATLGSGEMTISQRGGEDSLVFQGGTGTIGSTNAGLQNNFTLNASIGDLQETLNLNGRFIGRNAEGALVVFDIDRTGNANIVGTQVLTGNQ